MDSADAQAGRHGVEYLELLNHFFLLPYLNDEHPIRQNEKVNYVRIVRNQISNFVVEERSYPSCDVVTLKDKRRVVQKCEVLVREQSLGGSLATPRTSDLIS